MPELSAGGRVVSGALGRVFGRPVRRAAFRLVTPLPRARAQPAGVNPVRRRTAATAMALAVVAVTTPVGLAALPGGFELFGSRAAAIVLLALLILAPALVGLATVLRGLDALLAGLRGGAVDEYRQIMMRVFGAAMALFYVVALAEMMPGTAAVLACLVVAAFGLVVAWLVLLHAIRDPAPSRVRRFFAVAADVGLVSGFLHAGGGLTAAWYPVYFWIIAQNARRFGQPGLVAAAALSALGFAAAVATTGFWQQQPALSGGALAALVLLPLHEWHLVRRLAQTEARAEAARQAQKRFVALAGRDLRAPAEIILQLCASPPSPPGKALAAIRAAAGALLTRLEDALDSARIEAGDLMPEAEAFDLHALVEGILGKLRPQAEARSLALTLRIDPRLPYRLRGWVPQLRRVLIRLIGEAIDRTETGTVRVSFEAAGTEPDAVRMRIRIRGSEPAAAESETLEPASKGKEARRGLDAGLAVIERLILAMGGRAERAGAGGRAGGMTVELPLSIDRSFAAVVPDLAERRILIVTEDPQFAEALAEPLAAWRADPRWIGAGDTALAALADPAAGDLASVLIVDGRDDVLQALSWAQHAVAAQPAAPPLILFVAAEPWIDSLFELADGALAGIMPAPLSAEILGNALHALPPPAAPQEPTPTPGPEMKESEPAEPASVVTRIASHPRFAGDSLAPVDQRAVEALFSLGRGSDFFRVLIDAFRAEAREILAHIAEAAAAADATAFKNAADSLRSCAANVGGARLCEVLRALGDVPARELRQHGTAYVERVGAELARLEAALGDYLEAADEASR